MILFKQSHGTSVTATAENTPHIQIRIIQGKFSKGIVDKGAGRV